MLKAIKALFQRLRREDEKKGQGMVEYAAVIAFVAILVAVYFSFAKGTLFAAISDTYSTVTSTVDALNRASFEVGGGGGQGGSGN